MTTAMVYRQERPGEQVLEPGASNASESAEPGSRVQTMGFQTEDLKAPTPEAWKLDNI